MTCAAALAVAALLPGPLRAQTDELQVRPADREELTQGPRDAVAITFVVRNGTTRPIDAESHLTLPPGWRAITTDLPFALAERATAIRLVGFAIPDGAAAGDYAVSYEVRDRRDPALSAAFMIPVHVTAAVKMQVLALEAPDVAIAGERYESAFAIRNLGNSAVTARFTVRSAQGAAPQPRSGTLKLEVGESKRVVITSVAPNVRRRTDDQLTLALEVIDAPIRASASSATRIVPRVSPDEAYRSLATRAEMTLIGRDVDGARTSGWQPGISGGGALDEEGARFIDFRLRGPDARDRGSLGVADEYWLRYHDDTTSAELGDGIYGLTPLTEPGRYGTGAGFEYDTGHWGLASYRQRDRFNASGMEQTGLDAFYRPRNGTRLDATFLDVTRGALPGTIYSLRAQTRLMLNLNTDLEWGESEGAGERGQAMRASFNGSVGPLRYYATGWRADNGYRGYLRDKQFLSTGFDLPRRAGWGLHGYYRLQDWNLDKPDGFVLDTQRPPNVEDLIRFAPTERQASLGTGHALGPASHFTLDLGQRVRTDGHSSPPVDTTNRSVRFGFAHSLKQLSFLYTYERGITENDIATTRFNTALHLLTASWQASPAQSYGLYVFRDDNAFSNERQPTETSYGISANYSLGTTTSLSLSAQRNDAQTSRGALYNFALVHERTDGGRISLVSRRITGRQTQSDFLLTYSIPFAVPVARKSDVGSVHGRVFDSETGAGLANVVLNLDGLTAVTDREGDFAFPVVKANAYRLSMDRANVDVGKVPRDDLPREVIVVPRERQDLKIALVRTATLAATVTLPTNGTARAGVQNVLVALRRGDAVYRRLTDADGRIQLGGLAPGEWQVTLAPDTLPPGYAAQSGERRVELAPGAAATVEFALAAIARDIRMLPPLEVR